MGIEYVYKLIGLALLAWVIYDFLNGEVYLHRLIYRELEPTLYWSGMGIWTLLALSFFIY